VRLAALARAEPGSLGGGRRGVECDILGPCRTRTARRAAVHPGRLDRVDECAISARVAGSYRCPARGVIDGGRMMVGQHLWCPFSVALAGHEHNLAFEGILGTPRLAFEFTLP